MQNLYIRSSIPHSCQHLHQQVLRTSSLKMSISLADPWGELCLSCTAAKCTTSPGQ